MTNMRPSASPHCTDLAAHSRTWGTSGRPYREGHREAGPPPGLAAHLDPAAMAPGDLVGNGQSQPGPGGEEFGPGPNRPSLGLVSGSRVTSVRKGRPFTLPSIKIEGVLAVGCSGLLTLVGAENAGAARSTRSLSGAILRHLVACSFMVRSLPGGGGR